MTVGRRKDREETRREAFIQAKVAVNKNAEQVRKMIPTPRIPQAPEPRVPMVSCLPDAAENDPSRWPTTATYKPIGNNIAGPYLSEKVKEAIIEGAKAENKICCSCGPGVDCSTNPSCKCRIIAQSMADKFTDGRLLKKGEEAPFDDSRGDFWKENFYNCSESCACKGKCSLNALQAIDEHSFVIRRENEKGFCLFSNKFIKKGTAVVSFNGVMCGFNAITPEIEQYALMVIDDDKNMSKWLTHAPVISTEYAQLLKQSFMRMVYLNPLRKGNCARFLSHSCSPNVAMRRVFQGGLSPANIRIIMFAIVDINAGEELTFYYGEQYKKKFLQGCLCQQCSEAQRIRRPRSSVSADTEGIQSRGVSEDNTPSESPDVTVPRYSLRNVKREIESPPPESPVREIPSPPAREIPSPQSTRGYNHRLVIKEEIVTDDEDDEPIEDVVPEYQLPPQQVNEELPAIANHSSHNERIERTTVRRRSRRALRVRVKEEPAEVFGEDTFSTQARGRRDSSLHTRRSIRQVSLRTSRSPTRATPERHPMKLRERRSVAPDFGRQRSVSVRRSARLMAASVPPREASQARASTRPTLARRCQVARRGPAPRQHTPSPTPPKVRRVTRQSQRLARETTLRRSQRLRSVSQVDC